MKIEQLEMKVGIHDTKATLTRHRCGAVALKIPYIKVKREEREASARNEATNNNSTLAFRVLIFGSADPRAKALSSVIFTDSPLSVSDADSPYSMSLYEFLDCHCSDKF